ncbi:MAG: ABC transporter ATP-binding protein [Alphaproteobacteria bacterium]|jgi:ABC-2 type transport system ATP-binding protein|nr:ABC transporter ATP-binding protein [Alphaproteobacteria bacterium]MBT5860338.1 ABC transporter ATP-binding protein [Alphaproteobacteria bacterium]
MNEHPPTLGDGSPSNANGAITSAISARGVTKTYPATGKTPEVQALKSVDLTIPVGSFFGLLGPNGAGKSTLINILAGLVKKTDGSVAVWGHDIDSETRAARAAIGVVPQELNLDPFFTPSETMEFQAGLYGVPKSERRTAELLAAVRLTDQADAYARRLSGGMRRRLLLAKALAHQPPILVLDEPTAGVDVELRHQLWAYIRELNAGGVTVLLTTHYLEEAEALCDHVAIINHGEVIVHEPTAQLVAKLDRKVVTITLTDPQQVIPESLAQFDAELTSPQTLAVQYAPSQTAVGQVLDAVRQAGWTIADLTTEQSDLEEVFLALTSAKD